MTNLHVPLRKNASCGFTLLEVLVALAIFALISVMCYRQIDASFRTSYRIEQKYLAIWLAENKLEEMFVKRELPMLGEFKTNYKFSSEDWGITTTVTETDIKNFRKIEVIIYADEDYKNPVLSLMRYIGKE